MKQIKKDPPEQELYEKSWDWLGEIILAEDAERVSFSLNDAKIDSYARTFFEKYDFACQSKIDQFFRKEKWKRFFAKMIPQLGRMLCIIICIISVAIGIAVASSTTVRTYLSRLIIQSTPEYTILKIEKGIDSSIVIPDEWSGRYYPGKIPDGAVVGQIFGDSQDFKEVLFSNPDSGEVIFSFTEITDGTENIDAESAEHQAVVVDGHAGTVISKNDGVVIHWFDGNTLLIVYVRNRSIAEAITYAEGIIKIVE